MYESPITIITQKSHNAISEQFDDYILTTIKAELGCEVDKEELIKALAYDRNQYDKGFRDGTRLLEACDFADIFKKQNPKAIFSVVNEETGDIEYQV